MIVAALAHGPEAGRSDTTAGLLTATRCRQRR